MTTNPMITILGAYSFNSVSSISELRIHRESYSAESFQLAFRYGSESTWYFGLHKYDTWGEVTSAMSEVIEFVESRKANKATCADLQNFIIGLDAIVHDQNLTEAEKMIHLDQHISDRVAELRTAQ